jgi:DNA gyrase/topoisomerase IV subunit A
MTYSPEKYQAHKERIIAAKKRYYEKNRETILAKQKAYDDEHREQIKDRDRKRKIKKAGKIAID